jgi:tripartite-type tricarboxylate transporter receptor subunit TctC
MAVRPFSTDSVAKFDPDYLVPTIGIMFRGFVYAVPPDSPYDSIAELVEAAKARPAELRFCAGTATSTITLSGYVFLKEAGIKMTFIPSEGSGQAKTLMLGGGCDFMVAAYASGIEDQFKLLAISDTERNPVLPEVPTITEEGYSSLGGNLSGYGVLPEMPQAHRDWINALLTAVTKDQAFIDANQGALIRIYGVDEIKKLMQADIDAYYPVLEDLGMAVRDR